jgi:hypothetical protein
MTPGQRAYEQDVKERPTYHDGTPRPGWDYLASWAKWSWEKSPHPLPCPPQKAGDN